MKSLLVSVALAAGMFAAAGVGAQAPAGAPAGSTALCKDGTYFSGATKRGACGGHKGVKDWYGAAAAAPAAAPAAVPAPTPVKATTVAPAASPAKAATTAAAPGGGAGQVWVNTPSKVYHCMGTKWYGKTKKGEYMTEAAAKAAGNHADHGKACA